MDPEISSMNVDAKISPPDSSILPQGPAVASGLEGVIAADTRLSDVDGARGRLVIAGVDVENLAATGTFEGACARLWEAAGEPSRAPDDIRAALGGARRDAFAC